MNILIDGLPDTVEILGQTVNINTDFRTGILFEEMINDAQLSSQEKLQTALELYYPDVLFGADAYDEAVDKLLWFYRCGADAKPKTFGDEPAQDPPFSYEHDADYIYSAFLGAYGLDLALATLHWWQFRALFKSLPENTQLVKIIGYRTMEIPDKMPQEQRQKYERLKRIYALPQSADRQQFETDLNELLMNGGNPAALLGEVEAQWDTMEH